jgi:hypothetical protein
VLEHRSRDLLVGSQRSNDTGFERVVYDYAFDPANLPQWAPGLGSSVEHVDGQFRHNLGTFLATR